MYSSFMGLATFVTIFGGCLLLRLLIPNKVVDAFIERVTK